MSGKNDEAALHCMYVYTRICVCVCVYVSAAAHTTCTILFTMRRNGTVYVAVNCRGTSHGLTRNTVEVLDDHYRTSARGLPTWTHFNSVHEHRASIMRFMSIVRSSPSSLFSSFCRSFSLLFLLVLRLLSFAGPFRRSDSAFARCSRAGVRQLWRHSGGEIAEETGRLSGVLASPKVVQRFSGPLTYVTSVAARYATTTVCSEDC